MPKPLTPKQARFAEEYLVDLNATKAATRAGYSARTAHQQGHELLQHPEVKAAIDAAKTQRTDRVQVEADEILRELKHLALVDIRKAFDKEGRLLPVHQLPEEVARAISGIDVEEIGVDGQTIGHVKKLRFWDKKGALELLGKHLVLFTDKVEHHGNVSIAVGDPYAAPAKPKGDGK